PEHLGEVAKLTRVAASIFRGQTALSWGALVSARENDGPSSGAAGLLLNASRSLFPLSAGSFSLLLSSLVHNQDTADIAHAILAGLDRNDEDLDYDDGGGVDSGNNRYVAMLSARGPKESRLWAKWSTGSRREEDDHDDDDGVVSAGSSVVVTQAFAVTDTGMTVPRGTVCSVVEGVDERGNIHVKFPHRQPPWVALVGRLYATLAELQGMGGRFSEASAVSVAERLSDAQAVVGLMNSVFRHSECGPLRAETVLRSCAAQDWLVAGGFEHLARLLKESRRTLEGELRTGRCYADPYAKAELDDAGGAAALLSAFQAEGNPLPINDGSSCFAAQLPRILVGILRHLLPLVAAHPPQRSTAAETLLPGVDPFSPPAPGGCEAVLGASLYGLAAATVELLGTLAAYGAAAELRAV
ncbi:unnamed protein product, partial [Ectocarpus sp. 12 AP-2014]